MSCLDVMYQVFGPQPYFSSYSPYHHQIPRRAAAGSCPPPGPPGPPAIKEEDKDLPPGAEYLGARCVLFSYFQGDISSVVDEHFSRALSQTAAYPPPSSHKALREEFSSLLLEQLLLPFGAPPGPLLPGGPLQHPPAPAAPRAPAPPPPPPPPPHPPSFRGGALGAQGSAYRAPHEVYGPAFDPRYGSLLLPSAFSVERPSGLGLKKLLHP
ncbi:unnamed protein product [Menidia menidia]|uniref:(Atlantic silverside) hypothetical protein n=1 Tax=Menidia menidia TaxID=238744 RepID=A0A8S4BIV0_9TELE|nr:unnamed protein product [Menidia menidia]